MMIQIIDNNFLENYNFESNFKIIDPFNKSNKIKKYQENEDE